MIRKAETWLYTMVAIVPVNEQTWLGKNQGGTLFPSTLYCSTSSTLFFLVSCIPGPRSTVTGKYHGGVSVIHPGNDRNKRGAFLCTVGVGVHI